MNSDLPSINKSDWKTALESISIKYHKVGAWCAFAFNLIFSISDYFIMPEHWLQFFIIRSVLSLTILASIFGHKFSIIKHEVMIATAVLLISVENAYLYSVMDVEMFQQHTFAYIALFIGCGMLVLWEKVYSIVIVIANITSGLVLFPIFSPLTFDEIMANGGLLTLSVSIFTIFLISTRYNLTVREIKARLALSESNEQLAIQKDLVEERSQDITASITYAKRIQDAILPPIKLIKDHLPNAFVLFKPKDIVSGDFYWLGARGDKILFAAVDCTGHGVPGAMVSVIGHNSLNRAVREFGLTEPAKILDKLNELVKETFEKSEDEVRDGMDIAICSLDKKSGSLEFSGANNPLFLLRDGEVIETKGDKQPIGNYVKTKSYSNHKIETKSGDMLYIFSDGYVDQFGGPKGKKFKVKRMKELMIDIHRKKMEDQKRLLNKAFELWRGDQEQIDDVCIFGIKL
ncbi:MAG: SpoIIE family protein phosphatase [Flavobacteriales bacterium]|nr:SpoIIE family protein phosphatase [Flavobacteriales bacterium]